MSGPAPEAPAPLAVTVRLFAELEARGVRYCHWKSTPGLAIAMAGRTDLDLLVEREDAGVFAEVVRQLGFKPFISHPSRRFPAVDDLLGYDPETGRLVHLHVYYQLILGEHFVKNHRLPFERALIAASRPKDGVRIPPPELEVAILAYRTLLKYRDADATKDLLGVGHRGGIPREALAELRTLAASTSPDAVAAAMREHMPGLAPEPVVGLMEILRHRPRDARALVRVRRQARLALRPFERTPARSAWWRYMRARVGAQWPFRLLTRSAGRRAVKRKSPQAGGLMVAIVGSDGAGKSTARQPHRRLAGMAPQRQRRLSRLVAAVARHRSHEARREACARCRPSPAAPRGRPSGRRVGSPASSWRSVTMVTRRTARVALVPPTAWRRVASSCCSTDTRSRT